MARAAEMRMTESHNRFILVFVARAVSVHIPVVLAIDLVRQCIGIRTQLHRPERNGCSRIRMPHFFGANQWMNVGNQVLLAEGT